MKLTHYPISRGSGAVIDTRDILIITVITSAAATASVSRVDGNEAAADSSDTAAN